MKKLITLIIIISCVGCSTTLPSPIGTPSTYSGKITSTQASVVIDYSWLYELFNLGDESNHE